MHRGACEQYIFQSYNPSTFNAMHFDESQCEKENEQAEDRRVSNFTLLVLLVVFKWHHCSEGVKTHFFGWKSWSIVYAYKTQSSPQEERLWGIIPSFIIVHKRKDCEVLFLPLSLSLSVYRPKQQSVIIDSVATELRVTQGFNKRCSMNERNRKMDGTWKKQKAVLLFSSPQFCFLFACFFCLFGGFLYLWYHHGASHFAPHRCFTCQISDKGLF